MSNTLNTSRRARCAFSARATLAATLVALAGTGYAAGQPIEGDIDAAKALAYLYGNVQAAKPSEKSIRFGLSKQDCTEWALQPLPAAYFVSSFDGSSINAEDQGKKAEACKIVGEKYTDEGVEKYFLVTLARHFEGRDKEIHPDIVAASVFSKKDGQWVLESSKDFTAELREYNFISALVPGRASQEKPGVLLEALSGNMCMEHFMFALVPHGGEAKLSPLFSPGSDRDYHTLGVCNGCLDTFISFDTATQGEYNDIVVSYKNGEGCDSGVRPGKQRWRFQNGKYVKVKAAGSKKASAKKRK